MGKCIYLIFVGCLIFITFLSTVCSFDMPAPPPAPNPGNEENTPETIIDLITDNRSGIDVNDTGLPDRILDNLDGTIYTVSDDYSAQLDEIRDEITEIRATLDQHGQVIEGIGTDIATINQRIDEHIVAVVPSPVNKSITVFVVIGILATILALLGGFFLYKLWSSKRGAGKKSVENLLENPPSPPARVPIMSSPINQARIEMIRNYTSFNSKKGYSPTLIRNALMNQGYSAEEISAAFRRY